MEELHKDKVIRMSQERGDFIGMEDGYQYYWPKCPGAINALELRILADELDARNKDWHAQVMNDPKISKRAEQAAAVHKAGVERAEDADTPEGQKFPIGTRVHIAKDLGEYMSHFESDCDATVVYTYDQAYGGGDVDSYCLDVDGYGEISWYETHQLTEIKNR